MLLPRAIRLASAALLAAALIVPGVVEALARQRSRPSACLCPDHACCTFEPGAACLTSRAGRGCAGPRGATGPGLRAGCGCQHDAPAGIFAPREPALLPGPISRLDPPRDPAPAPPGPLVSVRSLARAPEPPPPRPSLPSA